MENKKRFYLSNDKKIAGVCGGIAEYFDTDPTFVRILFLALFLSGVFSAAIFVAYFSFWIIAPKKTN